jgi:hypothetical protein
MISPYNFQLHLLYVNFGVLELDQKYSEYAIRNLLNLIHKLAHNLIHLNYLNLQK